MFQLIIIEKLFCQRDSWGKEQPICIWSPSALKWIKTTEQRQKKIKLNSKNSVNSEKKHKKKSN